MIHKLNHMVFLLKQLRGTHDILIESSEIFYLYWNLSAIQLLLKSPITKQENTELDDEIKVIKVKMNILSKNLFANPYFSVTHICNLYAALNIYKLLKIPIDYQLKYKIIDYLYSLKTGEGSFRMYQNGEYDIRGTYTAIAILGLLDVWPQEKSRYSFILSHCDEYILSCQTYEGGFSGIPQSEAHGGYTFCAVASLSLLMKLEKCDLDSLIEWLYCRMVNKDDGFNGRTGKETDSCYGFWIGACFKIINKTLDLKITFDVSQIRKYILEKCQDINGGFRDKERNEADLQHTCYSLFFLSMYSCEIDDDFNYTVDSRYGLVVEKSKPKKVELTNETDYSILFDEYEEN